MNIHDIKTCADQWPVDKLHCTIKKVWPHKGGTNAHGDWSFQNVVLRDSSGEITAQFKNRPELTKAWENQLVILTPSHGEKGWHGLVAIDDDNNGAVTRKLRVTGQANIDQAQPGQGQAGPAAEQPRQQQAPPQQQQPPRQQQPPQETTRFQTTAPSDNDGWQSEEDIARAAGQQAPPQQQAEPKTKAAPDSVVEAKRTMIQIMNLHLLAASIVERVEAPAFKARTGHEMSESMRQGATASIFIESARTGLVRNMPTKLVED